MLLNIMYVNFQCDLIAGLQMTDVELDARVEALEANGRDNHINITK